MIDNDESRDMHIEVSTPNYEVIDGLVRWRVGGLTDPHSRLAV